MHILHYTLGFPPYRSGGLIKYASDLMVAQKDLGHNVCALYPSGMSLFHRKCHICFANKIKEIEVYKIVNPMPVPLLYGVKNIGSFINEKKIEKSSFIKLLDDFKPDILHIHTLMGLPKLFLEIAHKKNIKIVYTSHDYYGLCPKVNFINHKGEVCTTPQDFLCKECNENAKSELFLRLRNERIIIPIKTILRKWKK